MAVGSTRLTGGAVSVGSVFIRVIAVRLLRPSLPSGVGGAWSPGVAVRAPMHSADRHPIVPHIIVFQQL